MEWRCAHHFAAERLTNRLVTEANAEDRNGWRSFGDEIEANAGFVRRARARRQYDSSRLRCHNIGNRNLVVAMYDHIRSKPCQIMEKVEGEAVVVVDQDDHVRFGKGLRCPLRGVKQCALAVVTARVWPRWQSVGLPRRLETTLSPC